MRGTSLEKDMTKEELLAASKRERALGNDLVAACLHDAAYGNFPKKKEKNKMFNKIKAMPLSELSGWLGMILVQSATLPTTISVLLGYSDKLPPLSMVLLVWAGLALYFVRAYKNKDVLYMVSNGFGFFVNTILLALIVYPQY
jgi:hypothetical protein